MERRTVTHALAAKKLGVATRTIERMLRDGRLKAIPDRERLLVDANDLELVMRDRRLLRKRRQLRAETPASAETKTREAAPLAAAADRASVEAASDLPSRAGIPKLSTPSATGSERPAGITPLGVEIEKAPLEPARRIQRIVAATTLTDHPAKLATGERSPLAGRSRSSDPTAHMPNAHGGAAESLPIEVSPPSQAATSPAAIKPGNPGQSSAPRTSTSCFGGLTFGC